MLSIWIFQFEWRKNEEKIQTNDLFLNFNLFMVSFDRMCCLSDTANKFRVRNSNRYATVCSLKLHCAFAHSTLISTYGAARNFPVLSLRMENARCAIDSLCLSAVNYARRLRLLAIWQIFQIKFNWCTTQTYTNECYPDRTKTKRQQSNTRKRSWFCILHRYLSLFS